MQRTFAILAVLASLTTTAQAQRAWQSEIGVQGGFVRVKPAGTGRADQIDAFALPGANYVLGLLTQGSVYAIIPWSEKLAVEPSFVVSQLNGGGTNTTGRLGLRANYALTPKFYAAAGGVLLYLHTSSQQSKTLGLQGAVGYRMHLTGPLNARVELNLTTTKKTTDLNPFDSYGVLFGVSTRLHGTPAPAAARKPSATGRAYVERQSWSSVPDQPHRTPRTAWTGRCLRQNHYALSMSSRARFREDICGGSISRAGRR